MVKYKCFENIKCLCFLIHVIFYCIFENLKEMCYDKFRKNIKDMFLFNSRKMVRIYFYCEILDFSNLVRFENPELSKVAVILI